MKNPVLLNFPIAKKDRIITAIHNEIRADDYFWLRDKNNPDVIAYLEEENKYTTELMAHTEILQEKLYQEMVARIKETDESVPQKWGDYFYYHRTEKGKQYEIYCRKKGSLNEQEEILLDANELGEGKDYFSLGVFQVSPDHHFLAYSTDTNGSEKYTLYIKDLRAGKNLHEEISNTYYGVEWANDNRTIYYNTIDAASRPYRVYRHELNSDHNEDELVYEENDERYFVEIAKSRSEKYIFMNIGSKVTTEVRYLDADRPSDGFKLFHPREEKIEYFVEHHDANFYILTNDRAVNFKLMITPVHATDKVNWEEFLAHREDVLIEELDAFKNHLVIYEREKGLRRICVRDMRMNTEHYVEFAEPAYTLSPNGNPEYDTSILRFAYSSLITPPSTIDYDMNNRVQELKKQEEVIGYDAAQYKCERVHADATDGAHIPMSIVYKKGMVKNGNNPLLLYGYGSYGITVEPGFSSSRVSLLDRGVIFVIAHIRGGQELGRPWYENGKLLKKKNTFTDFIACAEYLVKAKYTSEDKMAITGASAGGLLMGAVTNMRPDLFKAVVAKVPFVDVANTMLDATLPLTVTEYEEWGNPNEKAYYDYIQSYAPYEQVEAKDYPNILATAGLHDPRVSFWEPAKWVAKLRSLKTDHNLLLLKTNMGAGHGGASGRYDYLKEIAFEYAFILDRVGKS
ncbi:S9 family peptidase [bacterium]|nr:S9 family peptidase [bacterium]